MSWGPFFYPHTIQVRDLTRGAGMGDSYADARALAAEVIDEVKLVRTADGSEVVSSTTVTVPLPENIPAGSLVTVWPGTPAAREAEVLVVARAENDPPLDSFLVLSLK